MTVKIWEVPDGGLTDKLVTPLQTLSGHSKPVTLLHYHPTANNVIASAAKDPSLKVWRRYAVCVCSRKKTMVQRHLYPHPAARGSLALRPRDPQLP